VLKHLIQEVRPATHKPSSSTATLLSRSHLPLLTTAGGRTPTTSYGMPSTHSTTIAFYGASLLLYVLPLAPLQALAGTAFCGAVCWSRVRLGHHTWPQVGAGVALGAVLGFGQWLAWQGVGSWEGVGPSAEGGWALVENVVGRVRAQM